jgi:hypothetical protein
MVQVYVRNGFPEDLDGRNKEMSALDTLGEHDTEAC